MKFKHLFVICLITLIFQIGCDHEISVDEVVANYIKKLGGTQKLNSVQSMKLQGQYFFNGMEYPLTVLKKRPNLYRIEISINDKKIIQGYDGQVPWEINEMQSTEAREIQDSRSISFLKLSSDFEGSLVNYKEKGHRTALIGIENVDGTETYHVEVTLKSGKVENWYIDSTNFTLLKKTIKMPHPYDPEAPDINQVLFYLDHKPVNGLLIPHYIEREDMQYIRELAFDRVELNPVLDTILFDFTNVNTKE